MKASDARKAIKAQGPCAVCGGPYAAHRMIDTQMGAVAAGEHIESVADDYGMTAEEMATYWVALMDLYERKARKLGRRRERARAERTEHP